MLCPVSAYANSLLCDIRKKKERIEETLENAKKNEFPFKPNTGNKTQRSDPHELIERLTNSKAGYYKSLEELKENKQSFNQQVIK